jgi:hypothetical protein
MPFISRRDVGRLVEHVAPEYTAELSSATFLRSLLLKLTQELIGAWVEGSGIAGADSATEEVLGDDLAQNAVVEGMHPASARPPRFQFRTGFSSQQGARGRTTRMMPTSGYT